MAIRQKKEWFLHVDGKNQGPFTLLEVRQRFQDKKVAGNTLVWQKGMENWKPLKGVSAITQKEFPSQLAAMEDSGTRSDPLLMESSYDVQKTYTDLSIKQEKEKKEREKRSNADSPSKQMEAKAAIKHLSERFPLESAEEKVAKAATKQKKSAAGTSEGTSSKKYSFLDDRDELTLAEKVSILTSLKESGEVTSSQSSIQEPVSSEEQAGVFVLDEKKGILREAEEETKPSVTTSEGKKKGSKQESILMKIAKKKEEITATAEEVDFTEELKKEKQEKMQNSAPPSSTEAAEMPKDSLSSSKKDEGTKDIEAGNDDEDFNDEDRIWILKTEDGTRSGLLSYKELIGMGVDGKLSEKFFLKRTGMNDFLPETNFPDLLESRKVKKKTISSLLSFSKKAEVIEKGEDKEEQVKEASGMEAMEEAKDFEGKEKKELSLDIELPSISLEEPSVSKEIEVKSDKEQKEGQKLESKVEVNQTDSEKKSIEDKKQKKATSVLQKLDITSLKKEKWKSNLRADISKVDTKKMKQTSGVEVQQEIVKGAVKETARKKGVEKEGLRSSLQEILNKKEKKGGVHKAPTVSKASSFAQLFKRIFYLILFAALAYVLWSIYETVSLSHYFKEFPAIANISAAEYKKLKETAFKEKEGSDFVFAHAVSKNPYHNYIIHVATNANVGNVMKIHLYGEIGELLNRVSFSLEREKDVPPSGLVSFGPLKDENGKPLPMGKYKMRVYIEGEDTMYTSRLLLGGLSKEDHERRMRLYKRKLQARYDEEYMELRQLIRTTINTHTKLFAKLKAMKSRKKRSFPLYKSWKAFALNTRILMKNIEGNITRRLEKDHAPVFYPSYYKELGKLSRVMQALLSKEKAIWKSSKPILTSGIQKTLPSKDYLQSFLTFTEPDEPAKVLVRNHEAVPHYPLEGTFSNEKSFK